MKSVFILVFVLLVSIASTAAFRSYWGGSLLLGRPVHQEVSKPLSDLQNLHWARRHGLDIRPVRSWDGNDFSPSGIEVVKPLNVHARAAREGYTAYYGVERQVIVPWRLSPLMLHRS